MKERAFDFVTGYISALLGIQIMPDTDAYKGLKYVAAFAIALIVSLLLIKFKSKKSESNKPDNV